MFDCLIQTLKKQLLASMILEWSEVVSGGRLFLYWFGTLGYAISDIKTPYLRYISNKGTFREDSTLGVQVDIQLSPEWGATAQVVGSVRAGQTTVTKLACAGHS